MFPEAIASSAILALGNAFRSRNGNAGAVSRNLTVEQRRHADEVLAASDRDDALAAMDEWIADVGMPDEWPRTDSLRSSNAEVAAMLEGAAKEELSIDSLRRTLGESCADLCAEGHTALQHLLIVAAILVRRVDAFTKPDQGDDAAAPKREGSTLRRFLYWPGTPNAVRREFTGLCRAGVAMLVIARAEELPQRLAPWMALLLSQTYRNGFVTISDTVEGYLGGKFDGAVMDVFRRPLKQGDRLIEKWWDDLAGDAPYTIVGNGDEIR
jgi:hypothetical protein